MPSVWDSTRSPWKKQHRVTLVTVPAMLGALAGYLLIAGLSIHHAYAALTACHPAGSPRCQGLNTTFNGTDWVQGNTVMIALQLVPGLIGAFAGAPQFVEAGWLLVLSVLLIAATVWLVRRRAV